MENDWIIALQNQSIENLVCTLFYTLIIIGRGKSEVSSGFIDHLLSNYDDKEILTPIIGKINDQNIEYAVTLTIDSLTGHSIDQILVTESFFGSLAEVIKKKLNQIY